MTSFLDEEESITPESLIIALNHLDLSTLDTNEKDIISKHRKLSLLHHPDRRNGDSGKQQEINSAKELIIRAKELGITQENILFSDRNLEKKNSEKIYNDSLHYSKGSKKCVHTNYSNKEHCHRYYRTKAVSIDREDLFQSQKTNLDSKIEFKKYQKYHHCCNRLNCRNKRCKFAHIFKISIKIGEEKNIFLIMTPPKNMRCNNCNGINIGDKRENCICFKHSPCYTKLRQYGAVRIPHNGNDNLSKNIIPLEDLEELLDF